MLALLPLLTLAGPADWDGHRRDFLRDPVALVRDGKDIAGSSVHTAEREGFRYMFANEANLSEFLRNPARYEIQLGGACGKMGPLSGLGSPEIYAVVADRLYVFASNGCRMTFQSDFESMLERDIPVPRPHSEAVAEGAALRARLLEWAGGPALDKLGSVQSLRLHTVTAGDRTYKVITRHAFNLPKYSYEESWDGEAFGYIVGGQNVFTKAGELERPMAQQMIRSAQRARNSTYLAALMAVSKNEGLIIGDGSNLTVYFDGSVATFELAKDGMVLALTTQQRSGMLFGKVRRDFSTFTTFRGVQLPTAWYERFERGEPTRIDGVGWAHAPVTRFSAR